MRTANIAALALTCFLAGSNLQQDTLSTGTVHDDVQFRVNCNDMQTLRITDQEYYERLEGIDLSAKAAIEIGEKFLLETQNMDDARCTEAKIVLEGVPHYRLEFFTKHKNRKKEFKYRRWNMQVGLKGKRVKTSYISYRLPGTVNKTPMLEMDNGMLYCDIKAGDGAMVRPGSTVRIDYALSLLDGSLVVNTHGENASRVFRIEDPDFEGLAAGLLGMRVNGKRKLVIPSALGFGEEGGFGGAVPPNATLVVDVVLRSLQ